MNDLRDSIPDTMEELGFTLDLPLRTSRLSERAWFQIMCAILSFDLGMLAVKIVGIWFTIP